MFLRFPSEAGIGPHILQSWKFLHTPTNYDVSISIWISLNLYEFIDSIHAGYHSHISIYLSNLANCKMCMNWVGCSCLQVSQVHQVPQWVRDSVIEVVTPHGSAITKQERNTVKICTWAKNQVKWRTIFQLRAIWFWRLELSTQPTNHASQNISTQYIENISSKVGRC